MPLRTSLLEVQAPSLGLRMRRGETSKNAVPATADVIIVVGGARANAHAQRDFELTTHYAAHGWVECCIYRSLCCCNNKNEYIYICVPLWEKVQFRANNEFELCMNTAVQVKLQVYPLFGMKDNYDPLPCSYHWTDSDLTILEPAVPCQNCTVDISAISARSVTEQIPWSVSTNTTRCTSPTYRSDFIGYLRLFCTPYSASSKRFFSIGTSKSMPP